MRSKEFEAKKKIIGKMHIFSQNCITSVEDKFRKKNLLRFTIL